MTESRVPDPKQEPFRSLEERFANRIEMTLPIRHNPKLQNLLELVNADLDLYGLWIAGNVNAVDRLHMTDHGPVHVKIVMNIAIRMLRLLAEAGIQPSVTVNYGMDMGDAEVVVAMASLLHDLGLSIHRDDHEAYSLILAEAKLREMLPGVYGPEEATILRSEILHAIISHRTGGRPLTLEAAIVRIADALDMAKGRSRIPFEAGSLSIHSVSAAAVEAVSLSRGEEKPICVTVELSNSAGLFQLDRFVRNKLEGSALEHLVEVQAKVGQEERQLLRDFRI
jgi:metal-dependent HD superfamily phosphatase/phosphodiesterase